MRSKTSFFNPTLFKKNLVRFWPLWGGASVLGALAPLAVLTALLHEGLRSYAGHGLEVTQGYYIVLSSVLPVISLFYAALCALAVWHYLFNARSVGFCHSLPITRKGLFLTNFLSGMAMMLIPYAVTGVLAVLISLAAGAFEPAGVLVTILGVLGCSFFYFAAATLIVFITGNPFAFAALYFIFHFIAAGAEWLVSELMSRFYYGVQQAYEGVIEFLSPTVFLIRKLNLVVTYQETLTPDGWVDRGVLESVTLINGWLIAVYALVGLVLLGCAWALYKRRRSESAGDVVAVGWMKPVFRYGVALCAALSGGAVLYAIFFADFQTTDTINALPMAVCMAVAGVVGYYIASMLLAKSLRVFRRSARGVLLTAAASMALCLVIAADPFGVETWVPAAGELTDVTISFQSNRGRHISANVQDPAVIQRILELHQAVLTEKDSLNSRRWTGNWANINLYYYLSDGSCAYRYYDIRYDEELLAQSEALRQAAVLATDPVIQEDNIFSSVSNFRRTGEQVTESRVISGYVEQVYNTETRKFEGVNLTTSQAKILEDAVRRDLQAGHFGKTLFLLDGEAYDRLCYSGELQLYYSNVVWRTGDGTTRNTSPSLYFGISTYCTETVKALEEAGVLDATHKLLTQAEVYAMDEEADPYSGEPYDDYYGNIVYPEEAIVYPSEGF